MRIINVAIVEDEPAQLSTLRKTVEGWPGFRCSGAYLTAEAALKQIPLTNPDVVIVDLGLPRMDGIRCIWELKRKLPKCEILVHSIEALPKRVFQAIQAGATGYLVKGASPHEVLAAIQEVHDGGSPLTATVARQMLRRLQRRPAATPDTPQLTQRQEQVLQLIVQGYKNWEIAQELSLAEDTIKTHIRHIYEVLQVHSRAEVIAWWHEQQRES